MKKLVIVILVFALCLTTGCAARDTSVPQDQGGNKETEATQEIEPSITPGTLPQMRGEEIVPQETYSTGKIYEPFGTPFSVEITNEKGTACFTVNVPDCKPSYLSKNNIWIESINNDDKIAFDYIRGEISSIETAIDTLNSEIEQVFNENSIFYQFTFNEKDRGIVEVNGRKMAYVKYRCINDQNGSFFPYDMMVYTVQLSNGTYVYWCVWSDAVFMYTRQTAENMAYTFTEISP